MSDGEQRLSKYELLHKLGQTIYGKVVAARNIATNIPVAIKQCDYAKMNERVANDGKLLENPMHEIEINEVLRDPGHPNIVAYHESFSVPVSPSRKGRLYIVMEMVSGGELFDILQRTGRCEEKIARAMFAQLMLGVGYIHSRGICHRDLSAENLLLDRSGNVKIADFGMAQRILPEGCSNVVGKQYYRAPEVLSYHQTQLNYDGVAADVWSCGVILYILLTGTPPFSHPHPADLRFKYITEGRLLPLLVEYGIADYFSDSVKELLTLIFQRDPSRRPSVEEILHHPWLRPELYGHG